MGNFLRKKVLVSQQAEEVVAGEETLLLSLEFKNKTKEAPRISDIAPVVEDVEVYSGGEWVQHEIHSRFHHVDQHRCELYITIERRLEADRAKVKLKLDSGYALSEECVFVKILERETSEDFGLTSSSSRNGVCKPKKSALRRKQGNSITLQNEHAYPYYGYMHNSAIQGYNAIRDFSTQKEHDTSSTQGEHDTSSTQNVHPVTYQRNKSDVSQSTTPALNNNTISSALETDNSVRTTTGKQPSIYRPRPIARKSTLSHPLALKYTSVSPTLHGHSSANELNDSTKNTASKRTLEAVSTMRDSYHASPSSTERKLTSQRGPSPTHNTPTTSAGNSSAYSANEVNTPALNGRSSASANEVNAVKNRASERKFENASAVPVSYYAPLSHTTSVVNNTSKATSQESSEGLSSLYHSFVMKSTAERQSTHCDPSPLDDARTTSADKSNSSASVTNQHQFAARPTSTSSNTDIFVPTTTAKQPAIPRPRSKGTKTTLTDHSTSKHTLISSVVNGESSASANEDHVNAATKNTESEKPLQATSYQGPPIHKTRVLDNNSSKLQSASLEQLARWNASLVSRSAEKQKTQCDGSLLHRTPTTAADNSNSCGSVSKRDHSVIQPLGHSTGPDHFQKGTTASQSSVSSPKAAITPPNPTALKNRSTNQAEKDSSPISTSKTDATGNADSKRKSVSACAVRDHSVSKDWRTTQVRSLHSDEQRMTFGVNGTSKEQPFKVSQPKRYFLTNLTYTAERSSSDPIIQSDIHQLYYYTWTIFEADIMDYHGEQHATNVDIVDVISSSYGVQFDNTYTANDGRLRIRLRAFYQYLDAFEMYITLRCWNNSAEAVIIELVHVNRPANVLGMPAPSVPSAVTKNPKPSNTSALHSTSTTPVLDNSSSKQETNLDRSGLVINRPAEVLGMPAPTVPGAVTRKPKPSNTSALHSTPTYPVFDNSSSKQQTKVDLSVSPQHPTPSKTTTGNLPFASSSTARKLTNQCDPSSTDSTPTSADHRTSSSSATAQNKLVIQPPTSSTSTVVLNKIPTAGRSSIASPTERKGTSSNPSALRNTPTPLVLNGCTPTRNNASVTDKKISERKLSSSTSSLQGVNSPLFHTPAISLGKSTGSTQPTSPDRVASSGLAPTRLKSSREDHISCPTTSKLAQCNPSAQRSTPTATKDNSRSTSQDLLVTQPLRYSMCTNLLKDTANPTAAPSPTAKQIPNSKAVQNRSANETLGRSSPIPTSRVNATGNPNSKGKSASKMRDTGLNTTSTTSLLFPPPSVNHSVIEVTSPDHRPVKAGETLVFKIHVRDQNGRAVNSGVQYKLLVKLRNKTIPSDRENRTVFRVTPQCSGENSVSFSIDGKEKIWQFDVLPSKPASLRNVKFSTEQSRLDPSFRPQNDLLYDDVWATLEADVQDKFGNVVQDVDTVQVSSTSSNIEFDTCTALDGKFNLRLKASVPYHLETKEITITLRPTDSEDEAVLKRKVDVTHAPCSSALSRVKSYTNVCTVAEDHKIHVEIMNVFNNPVSTEAGVTCVVYAKTLEPHFKAGEYSFCDTDVIYITENENGWGKVQLDVTIIPKRVGPRQIMVYLNGEQMDSSEANFEVRPNLRKLQCKSIRRSQREGENAILEAKIEDCGGNSIAVDTVEDIRLVRISGPLNGLACQSSKIQPDVALIEHTLLEDERYFLRLETHDGVLIHTFEVDTHDDIPQSGDAQDKQFLLYSETMCRITKVRTQWSGVACRGATKRDIKGPDCAHLQNMKRVLNLRGNVELTVDRKTGGTQIRFRANVSTKFLETCRELVLHLLRGNYYRKKASEVARHRMLWKERVEILEERKYKNSVPSRSVLPERLKSIPWTLQHCRSERDIYGKLMNEYNRQASFELFAFFNYERQENEVDLHGLFVADESKYAALRKKLEDKEIKDRIIEEIISRCRWQGDEAIRKLEDKLRSFDLESARESGEPWIEIVVGAGHHSREKQKIRPKVENFLRERSTEFAPVNKGSLVVTLEKYDGPEPCFAEFYCQECDRCWRSGQSWSNKPQACEHCKVADEKEVDCWPLKQSAEERPNNNWRGERSTRNRAEMQHKVDLCKECKSLGQPCYKFKSNRRSARSANP